MKHEDSPGVLRVNDPLKRDKLFFSEERIVFQSSFFCQVTN